MAETRTAVVTHATSNAALAIVRALLEDGMQVALVDPDAMRLDSLIRFLRGATLAVPAESSEAGSVRQAHQQIEKLFGPVDILVNIGEETAPARIETLEPEEFRRHVARNLDGAYHWSRAVLPAMRKRGWGRIVNVISAAAKGAPVDAGAAQNAAHGAIESLTFALARETAAQGITVNAIAAGFLENSPAIEQLNEAQRRQLLAQIPVGRFCKPEELAHAARFLASPLAGFVTGEIVDVNGGVLMD